MTARRAFIGLVGAGIVMAPLDVAAQREDRLPRIALVFNNTPVVKMAGAHAEERTVRQFVQGLRELGYIEGRNIVIERRSAEGRSERMRTLMQELVDLRVDAIVTAGPGALAAQRATDTIPIVALFDDPDSVGLTGSLARPGRNITGMTDSAGSAIHGKRLQLLKEAAPKCERVAAIDYKYVDMRTTPGAHLRRRVVEAAARELNVTLIAVGIDRADEFPRAFEEIINGRADALIEMGTPLTYAHRHLLIDFAARRRLPAVYSEREFTEAGGLMSYAADADDQWRRMAAYVDKLLKGAKPADLPIEQPARFELIINLHTAKELGLAIPKPLLLRADEVIQ
jgi:putative ABC transport system substrate-binding protein